MASRMDRYSKSELISSGRSDKNKSLYKRIEDLDSYTNIEGVTSIENVNQIDISQVKNLISNRENYNKKKKLKNLLETEKKILEKEEITNEDNLKVYDINDVFSRIKKDNYDKSRSLSEESYNDLSEISNKNNNKKLENNEMIELEQQKESSDDCGLFDELKSNTMVGDASSIKKILDEEKEEQQKINEEIDKSFYTSSFGFTRSDFDELKSINHGIKKSNKLIIILLVFLITIILCGIIFFVINK